MIADARRAERYALALDDPKLFDHPPTSREKRIFPPLPTGRPNLGLLNVRSVKKRGDVICDTISTTNNDLLAITETWLNVTHGDHIIKKACPSRFSALHVPRPVGLPGRKKNGGGVGRIYRNLYDVKQLSPLVSASSFDILDVSVQS